MKLGKRLCAVAEFVIGARSLIDVGCDHAYLPIYLVKKGIIDTALACDIALGPLDIANANIEENGLDNRIITKLSDGLLDIDTDGYDCLTICGMGGITILNILKNSIDKVRMIKKIIISPQSEEDELLDGLKKLKLNVINESFIKDRNKFYHLLVIENGDNNYFYGKYLQKNAIYISYLDNKILRLKEAASKFENGEIPVKLAKELGILEKRRKYASEGYNN